MSAARLLPSVQRSAIMSFLILAQASATPWLVGGLGGLPVGAPAV